MTLDRSLKVHGGLVRTRSVLTRAERITMLTEEGKFDPIVHSPLGLPKVKVRHSKAGTKTKKEEKPVEGAAEGEAVGAEGQAAAGAAPAGEAKGAKGEAKAAKGEAKGAKGEAKGAKPEAKAAKSEAKGAKGGKG